MAGVGGVEAEVVAVEGESGRVLFGLELGVKGMLMKCHLEMVSQPEGRISSIQQAAVTKSWLRFQLLNLI